MRNTRLLWISAAVLLTVVAGWLYSRSLSQSENGGLPIVAVTQIATHPALDKVRIGLIDGLARRGYVDGKTISIIFRNANGDASLTLPIAQDFVQRNATIIVPISTPSTLAVQKSTERIPIVFSGVADPLGSGVVMSLDEPGGNITGVCDQWPFREQVEAFLSVFPETETIGLLYTKGDDVSRVGVDALEALKDQLGFKLELVPISSAEDIYPAAVALLKRVDAVFTGIDHLILGNMDGLAKAARESRKPLFGGEPGSVEKGAVLALSIDMTEFGDATAELVAQVLEGKDPGTIPVRIMSEGVLLINENEATRFDLDLDVLRERGAKFVGERR